VQPLWPHRGRPGPPEVDAGLAISLPWRVAAGATIVLVAAALFAVSLVVAPRHGLLASLR
jgi:ABC-type Mn2+/Zn2+ transport system permease subunit